MTNDYDDLMEKAESIGKVDVSCSDIDETYTVKLSGIVLGSKRVLTARSRVLEEALKEVITNWNKTFRLLNAQ